MKMFEDRKSGNRRVYWSVISLVALSCGGTALAQSAAPAATNAVPSSVASTNVTDLGNVTVVGKLNQSRNQIVPDLGASAYAINENQIAAASQGGDDDSDDDRPVPPSEPPPEALVRAAAAAREAAAAAAAGGGSAQTADADDEAALARSSYELEQLIMGVK